MLAKLHSDCTLLHSKSVPTQLSHGLPTQLLRAAHRG